MNKDIVRVQGVAAYLPLTSELMLLCKHNLLMQDLERLLARAGKNNELTFCECKLDGEDFSFYVKPMTAAQIVEARKSTKGADRSGNQRQAVYSSGARRKR